MTTIICYSGIMSADRKVKLPESLKGFPVFADGPKMFLSPCERFIIGISGSIPGQDKLNDIFDLLGYWLEHSNYVRDDIFPDTFPQMIIATRDVFYYIINGKVKTHSTDQILTLGSGSIEAQTIIATGITDLKYIYRIVSSIDVGTGTKFDKFKLSKLKKIKYVTKESEC